MTLDCRSYRQPRVISARSWYLTSFVILSFCCLPFAWLRSIQNTKSCFFYREYRLFFCFAFLTKGEMCLFLSVGSFAGQIRTNKILLLVSYLLYLPKHACWNLVTAIGFRTRFTLGVSLGSSRCSPAFVLLRLLQALRLCGVCWVCFTSSWFVAGFPAVQILLAFSLWIFSFISPLAYTSFALIV